MRKIDECGQDLLVTWQMARRGDQKGDRIASDQRMYGVERGYV